MTRIYNDQFDPLGNPTTPEGEELMEQYPIPEPIITIGDMLQMLQRYEYNVAMQANQAGKWSPQDMEMIFTLHAAAKELKKFKSLDKQLME